MKAVHRTLAALAVAAPLIAAQTCSCSPTAYSFALNFAGSCSAIGFDGAGVFGSICFFTAGGDPSDIDTNNPLGFRSRRLGRLPQGDKMHQRWSQVLSEIDFSSHIAHAKAKAQAQARKNESRRRMQLDTTPVAVTSAMFFEADTTPQVNIINYDSTYLDIAASDGDVLDFTSISSTLDPSVPIDDQLDLVPGSVMMVLFGTNDAGEVVRNTVALSHDNEYCGGEPLATGDSIGWVTLEGYTPPIPEFCPSSAADVNATDFNATDFNDSNATDFNATDSNATNVEILATMTITGANCSQNLTTSDYAAMTNAIEDEACDPANLAADVASCEVEEITSDDVECTAVSRRLRSLLSRHLAEDTLVVAYKVLVTAVCAFGQCDVSEVYDDVKDSFTPAAIDDIVTALNDANPALFPSSATADVVWDEWDDDVNATDVNATESPTVLNSSSSSTSSTSASSSTAKSTSTTEETSPATTTATGPSSSSSSSTTTSSTAKSTSTAEATWPATTSATGPSSSSSSSTSTSTTSSSTISSTISSTSTSTSTSTGATTSATDPSSTSSTSTGSTSTATTKLTSPATLTVSLLLPCLAHAYIN